MGRGWRAEYSTVLGVASLSAALPSWMTMTRGAGSWSRQTAAAVNGTTFLELGTAQNTARFDYDPQSGRQMLLIEPTRTNLVVASNFVDSAPDNHIPDGWSVDGTAGTDFACDKTLVAPHGGVGTEILYIQDTAIAERGCYVALAAGANTFACSGWYRRTAAGAASVYGFHCAAWADIDLGAVAFDWTRKQVVSAAGGGAVDFMSAMRARGDSPGVVAVVLPQLEVGDCASSVIPTTAGAIARAAELLTVDPSVVGRLSGCVEFLWRPDYESTSSLSVTPCLFAWAAGYEIGYDPADDKLKVYVGGVARASSAALTFARQSLHRVRVRYSSAGTQLTVDGVTTTDATAWGDPGVLATYLGSRAASVNCRPSAYGDFLSAAL